LQEWNNALFNLVGGEGFALMNTSLSALQADQAALDATSNNVANQNTVGYTREVVNFQTTDVVTLNGSAGDGVSIGSGPVSQRDRVLEQRVQQQTQTQSQSAALESAIEQVQSIFNLSSNSTSASTTALGTAVDGFFSSLTALASNPSDTATRQNDPLEIAAAGIGEGSLGDTNAQALADLSTASIAGGTTASSYYATYLGQVGNTAADATAESTQQQAALTQLTTQRDALSGVSLDEAAANLTQYQRSYQAASQVFNIVNTLMASAINLGVETTVS
jgi:flagellar hook-associated protein 1